MSTRSDRLVAALVPEAPHLQLEQVSTLETTLLVSLTSTAPSASCPRCGVLASRIRSRYLRTLADLPWSGLAVKLQLTVRKFACDVPSCPQRIFTERLPSLTLPYARRTHRLAEILRAIAFTAGGEGGSRLLDRLRMPASASTLLRLIRRTLTPSSPTPRVLGVDEWARRKGQTYSTILVDLEQHRPIELLPDRTAQTLQTWLAEHPGVEIISRDRGGAFAEGATLGAPSALQVADRWHLLGNLREALERALQSHTAAIKSAFVPVVEGTSVCVDDIPSPQPSNREQTLATQRRSARLERYTTVQALHEQGVSRREIARRLGLSPKTVQRWVRSKDFPERQARPRRLSRLDPYKPYLLERWNAGCTNGVQLFREIGAQGYSGGRSILRDFLSRLRKVHGEEKLAGQQGASAPLAHSLNVPPTMRQLIWYVMRRPETLKEAEREAIARLRTVHEEIAQAVQFTQEFAVLVRGHQADELEGWLWRVANSNVAALQSFAAGIQRDKAAVVNGLRLEYSQGQVEGQITRLKLLKRTMYGRAKLDLLRKRVLYAA